MRLSTLSAFHTLGILKTDVRWTTHVHSADRPRLSAPALLPPQQVKRPATDMPHGSHPPKKPHKRTPSIFNRKRRRPSGDRSSQSPWSLLGWRRQGRQPQDEQAFTSNPERPEGENRASFPNVLDEPGYKPDPVASRINQFTMNSRHPSTEHGSDASVRGGWSSMFSTTPSHDPTRPLTP